MPRTKLPNQQRRTQPFEFAGFELLEIAAVSLDPSSASKPATDLRRLINLLSRLQYSRHTAVAPAN